MERTGRFRGVRYMPSPNCDARPNRRAPTLIVIHGISLPPGQFGGTAVQKLFTNRLRAGDHPYFKKIADLRVSAHLFIRRDGKLIQFVPFHKRAWHAGDSSYCGRKRCNDFSIGIELEGTDRVRYTDAQYTALASSIAALLRAYPSLSVSRIVGHADIAPGRKTDPGPAFDWAWMREWLVGC